MIRAEDLVLRHRGAAEPAVRGVSFDAPAGRITAIVGPNGSGKSTIVRALLGRLVPEGGRVSLDGEDLATLDRRTIASRMAVVPQREEPVFPFAVRDFIALGRYPHGGAFAGRTTPGHWD